MKLKSKSLIFSLMILSDNVKNSNEPQFISSDIKNNIKRMAMEQSLYAQVVKLCRKDLKFVAAYKNKNEAKFKFQGQSARSKWWFHIDLDWIEVNFSTREPNFYKKLFQIHDDTQDINTFIFFQVPIVNAKCVESFKFQNDAPIHKYCQKSLNSCCLGILASAFDSINHNKSDNAISLRIKESLESEVGNRIDFADDTLKNNKINKGETKLHYSLIKYMQKGLYKILEDISENVTLVQLMD